MWDQSESAFRIRLDPFNAGDVGPHYLRWMNDPEVNRYLESRFAPVTMEDLTAFVEGARKDPGARLFRIVLSEDDRHIGNLKLAPILWPHRSVELGILIGEKDCWGKGFATEAIALGVRFAFKTLGLRRVTAGCYGSNLGSVRAFEKVGFDVEGRRPAHLFDEGEYVEKILLGLSRPTGS